ncbi:MAG: hypothetical protein Q8S73_32195 [Deltaproteobacteria bacterium]|nr:hypothetical protein [Myxococcales bacterium]MDP3218809.1 hypothetical protein [Deltaproteobacteria bacterium]
MIQPRMAVATLAALSLPLVFAVACDDHTVTSAACSDRSVISLPACPTEDGFSDETCQSFDDRTANGQSMANDARSPAIAAPTEGQALPGGTPFTFQWMAPTSLRRRMPVTRALTLADEWHRWTTLIPEAQAHCPPFSGRGYDLIFRSGDQVVFRRQQSGTAWTPDAAAWARLRTAAAGGALALTIQTATFSANLIPSGSGPFVQSAPRRFTIAP